MTQQDALGYTPPTDEIPESEFGGTAPDGIYPCQVANYQVQDNGSNAWVRAKLLQPPYDQEGLFSMNLYLPTREELNKKLRDKGNKAEALKSFFHWKQTCKALGIPGGLSIREALERMKGVKAQAKVVNDARFGSRIEKFLATGESTGAPPAAPPETADAPF